jgi:hypothetical protein
MIDSENSLDDIVARLSARVADARATIDLLREHRREVAENAKQFENPQAVQEYIDVFLDLFDRAVAECERTAGELPRGVTRTHVDALRQLASNSAAEQRRCLIFRDKWINKPLPYEQVRPVLNQISVTTRDQLTAFRDLNHLAEQLGALWKQPLAEEDRKAFDRRALFTRLFKPPGE